MYQRQTSTGCTGTAGANSQQAAPQALWQAMYTSPATPATTACFEELLLQQLDAHSRQTVTQLSSALQAEGAGQAGRIFSIALSAVSLGSGYAQTLHTPYIHTSYCASTALLLSRTCTPVAPAGERFEAQCRPSCLK